MIYHIAIQKEWDDHAGSTEYAPIAYGREGFIHCCDFHQLMSVANGYFPGREDLVVLELVPTRLKPETRYERSGNERFPHVYGLINKNAINRAVGVQCNADGLFEGVFNEL